MKYIFIPSLICLAYYFGSTFLNQTNSTGTTVTTEICNKATSITYDNFITPVELELMQVEAIPPLLENVPMTLFFLTSVYLCTSNNFIVFQESPTRILTLIVRLISMIYPPTTQTYVFVHPSAEFKGSFLNYNRYTIKTLADAIPNHAVKGIDYKVLTISHLNPFFVLKPMNTILGYGAVCFTQKQLNMPGHISWIEYSTAFIPLLICSTFDLQDSALRLARSNIHLKFLIDGKRKRF